jgi:hypothetical protein
METELSGKRGSGRRGRKHIDGSPWGKPPDEFTRRQGGSDERVLEPVLIPQRRQEKVERIELPLPRD